MVRMRRRSWVERAGRVRRRWSRAMKRVTSAAREARMPAVVP